MSKERQTILLLTGKNWDGRREDLFLANYLERHFSVIISNIEKVESLADKVDLILIRNIWPTSKKFAQYKEILSSLSKRNIPYNPGLNLQDLKGKDYLMRLFKKGFPVIPSIDRKEDIFLLNSPRYYFIKPKHGGSREGCIKISKKQLSEVDFRKNIAQPFIDFKYEVSFYFIDNKLVYALYAPNKHNRWVLKPLKIGRKEKAFAQQFVDWNNLKYGIQRIDAVGTKDNRLLLMEIEDWCPYLSLLDIKKSLRNKLLKEIVKSIKRRL